MDKYSTEVVSPPPVDKYSTEVVYPPALWKNVPLLEYAPPLWIGVPLRWCTPPPQDKYSTEVLYPPPCEKIPLLHTFLCFLLAYFCSFWPFCMCAYCVCTPKSHNKLSRLRIIMRCVHPPYLRVTRLKCV